MSSNEATSRLQDAGTDAEPHSPGAGLALLYQGLLTGIIRVASRRQHVADAESFRRKTKSALQQVEREASAAGYHSEDVRDTHLAVVAFLDEVMLNGEDPIRGEWERRTLQQDLFGLSDAGVVFFEKLENLAARRDSSKLADILEVYLLCLLLGFQGRYSGRLRGELDTVVERIRKRIERIRGRTFQLSPNGGLPQRVPEPEAPVRRRRITRWELAAAVAAVATLILFIGLKLNLIWAGDQVSTSLIAR